MAPAWMLADAWMRIFITFLRGFMFDLESPFVNENNDLNDFFAPEIHGDFGASVVIKISLQPLGAVDLDDEAEFLKTMLKGELKLLGSDAISIVVANNVIDLKVKLPLNLSIERLYRALENRLQTSWLMRKKTPIFLTTPLVKSIAG